MASVLRDVWFTCVVNDVHIQVVHKPGEQMTPDLLSRGFKTLRDWLNLLIKRM